jgi:hypothetical protein
MKNINLASVAFIIMIGLFLSCKDNNDPGPFTGGNNNGTNSSIDSTSNNDDSNNSNEWLINVDEVYDGGPGKDGIPSIDAPKFLDASYINFLDDDDLVIGYADNGEFRAFPHQILDWHEIVNDQSETIKLSIIYCPLTGTATAWDRNTSAGLTTFGVSGLLYNTNVIPYDRNTDSNWSQIYLKAVNGALAGEEAKLFPIIETTWKTWRTMYPDSRVLSRNTGYDRNYDNYPYGNYKTDHDMILFPVSETDDRLNAKDRVLSVIFDETAKAYPIKVFNNGISVIQDNSFQNIVVVGSQEHNFAVAFKNSTVDGTSLNFTPINNQLPLVMEDDEGSKWDVFGEAREGPRTGEKLAYPAQMIGYWFSFPSFYEDLKLYE